MSTKDLKHPIFDSLKYRKDHTKICEYECKLLVTSEPDFKLFNREELIFLGCLFREISCENRFTQKIRKIAKTFCKEIRDNFN